MKIILVKSEEKCFASIFDALNASGYDISVVEAPDEPNEQFIAVLLNLVKETSPEFVMSLGFIPYLSNACSIMGEVYVSWIVGGYDYNNYDPAIQNDSNRIFVADSQLYKAYQELNLLHIWFLPLAPEDRFLNDRGLDGDTNNNAIVRPSVNGTANDHLIRLFTDSINPRCSVGDKLNLLKDSTKGYLDAFCEYKKRDLLFRPVFNRLHDYIREDIFSHYKLENGIQNTAESFDYMVVYPVVDESLAIDYIDELLSFEKEGHLDIVTYIDCSVPDKRIAVIRREPRGSYDWFDRCYDYTVFLPGFLSGSRITQDMWNTMAIGDVILLPEMIDTAPLGEIRPQSFKNQYELTVLARAYSGLDDNLSFSQMAEDARIIKEKIRSKDNYNLRIVKMLSYL